MASQAAGPVLRYAAWIAAVIILGIFSVVFTKWFSVLGVAAISAIALFTAAVPIVAIGFLFFPAQFPMDTEPEQVAMRIAVELLGLCTVAAIIAAVIAMCAKSLVRHNREGGK
jgi:CBS domain containing-hemolysin-like protein